MRFRDEHEVVFESDLLRVIDYRCAEAEPKILLPEGTLDLPTVLFPRRGVFFRHEGSRSLLGDSNHVLFFDTDAPFRISYPIEGGDDSTFFQMKPGVLAGVVGAHSRRSADRPAVRFPAARVLSGPALFLRHRALLESVGRGMFEDRVAVEEELLDVVGRAVAAAFTVKGVEGNGMKEGTARAHRESAESVKVFLGGRFTGRLSLGEIARGVSSSPYHLSRLFKRETGLTIHRYLNRLRLRASLERLVERAANLTEIALDLGFSSHSHFTDAFRREFGFPPSSLRRLATIRRVADLERKLVA